MSPADARFKCPHCGTATSVLAGASTPADAAFARIRGCPSCKAVAFTIESVLPQAVADAIPPAGLVGAGTPNIITGLPGLHQ